MASLNLIADRYVALWNEPDDARRWQRLTELFSADAEYVMFNNPPFVGLAAIYKQISIAHRVYVPRGRTFRSSANALGHNHVLRFSWVLLDTASGEPDMMGSDVLVLDGTGRIRADYQFHDEAFEPVLREPAADRRAGRRPAHRRGGRDGAGCLRSSSHQASRPLTDRCRPASAEHPQEHVGNLRHHRVMMLVQEVVVAGKHAGAEVAVGSLGPRRHRPRRHQGSSRPAKTRTGQSTCASSSR